MLSSFYITLQHHFTWPCLRKLAEAHISARKVMLLLILATVLLVYTADTWPQSSSKLCHKTCCFDSGGRSVTASGKFNCRTSDEKGRRGKT